MINSDFNIFFQSLMKQEPSLSDEILMQLRTNMRQDDAISTTTSLQSSKPKTATVTFPELQHPKIIKLFSKEAWGDVKMCCLSSIIQCLCRAYLRNIAMHFWPCCASMKRPEAASRCIPWMWMNSTSLCADGVRMGSPTGGPCSQCGSCARMSNHH